MTLFSSSLPMVFLRGNHPVPIYQLCILSRFLTVVLSRCSDIPWDSILLKFYSAHDVSLFVSENLHMSSHRMSSGPGADFFGCSLDICDICWDMALFSRFMSHKQSGWQVFLVTSLSARSCASVCLVYPKESFFLCLRTWKSLLLLLICRVFRGFVQAWVNSAFGAERL